jgi:excinuclease ABC subunit B
MTDLSTKFKIIGDLSPKGDQKQAISSLLKGIHDKEKYQILLGITGSGKTFTIAKVIENLQRPTLILAHNKTLATQLYSEFKLLFPENSVHYFVSYYDYYQPEAYVPSSDTFIEKDAQINEEIDRLRHSATNALLTRKDVIIIASVSCIFGIGSPEYYLDLSINLKVGDIIDRDKFLANLVDIQYSRNDIDFYRGKFRVRGDVVEIFPADADRWAFRIEWFGDEIESIKEVDPFRGLTGNSLKTINIFPSSHYVLPQRNLVNAIKGIKKELALTIEDFTEKNKLLELERVKLRALNDIEMLETINYCKGIENYSRHIDGREPGEPPSTLIDYFPDDFLFIIDESHQTLPQTGAMYKGDRSRKTTLIEHGFRLPSALDNRPLKYEEFLGKINQVIFSSATPGIRELELTQGVVVEQIIRPTGLLDPLIEIHPLKNQMDDLLNEIRKRTIKNEKILVLTLTKRFSEQLTEYFLELGIKVRYLHSEILTIERAEILRDLRRGDFDVLVGINLLREGLDLPEVTLVAILDADSEGFLRSERSLFQICGRAARNIHGKVIMYADRITKSMDAVMKETDRRREVQNIHNQKHGITPTTIQKDISDIAMLIGRKPGKKSLDKNSFTSFDDIDLEISKLKKQMKIHAKKLEFEQAASIRDKIKELEEKILTELL